jgi:hypothetical protein
MYRHLTNLADIARSAGLTVVEIPGWKTRGRPARTGNFDPNGVLCHHTGGRSDSRAYAEWMALEGRPDLPAPLAHFGLSRTGIVYVLAAGRANHAGKTRAIGSWLKAGDGNAQLIGIEAMNTGSEGWSGAQHDAYVRLCAALCKSFGWPASHVVAHRETSLTGKPDPGGIDMGEFRGAVAVALKADQKPDVPGPTIWTKSIVMAYGGAPMNAGDSVYADARAFTAWGRAVTGLGTQWDAAWVQAIADNRYADAGAYFRYITEWVQRKFSLSTSTINVETILAMKPYGYVVLDYSGRPL